MVHRQRLFRHDRSLDGRERSRDRAVQRRRSTRSLDTSLHRLRNPPDLPLLGSAPRRSSFRENRRFPRRKTLHRQQSKIGLSVTLASGGYYRANRNLHTFRGPISCCQLLPDKCVPLAGSGVFWQLQETRPASCRGEPFGLGNPCSFR